MNKKTKIICTIGPASSDPKILEALARAGMDVARLNLSHGDYESHARVIKVVRKISERLDRPIGIMLDLQGPKIRIGEIEGKIILKRSEIVILSHAKDLPRTKFQTIPIQVDLRSSLQANDPILIDDGKIHLSVTQVKGVQVWARVEVGGALTSNKGINLPSSAVKVPLISEKDEADLKFGLAHDVDFVALSFVQSPNDVVQLSKLIKRHLPAKAETPWIIAKIEKPSAVASFEKILQYADGAMVARGDLGVEIPSAEVPLVQKKIVEACLRAPKPSVVATQMLDSMVSAPTPTRAEVSDVAGAVTDHADAVMLSAETAVGKYPVEAVEVMVKVILEVESSNYDDLPHQYLADSANSKAAAIADSAHELSKDTNAKAIVGVTSSGFTARMISHQRPQNAEIIMMTNSKSVYQKLSLLWGVRPYILPKSKSLDELIKNAINVASNTKLVQKGDKIVIVTGQPVGVRENMNLVEVQTV